jgi:YjbE family integral membrane protein
MEWIEVATHGLFWKALIQIIAVNIMLSGDNAVVIALAARNLPQQQQKMAIMFGSGAAIVLRIVLTVFAVALLQYPYLKLIGACLLIWIGAKMLLPEEGEDDAHADAKSGLLGAVKTILIADLVMSLDNVLAVAAAAETGPPEGKIALLIIGLGLSIPLIIFGSQLLLKLMDRWPIIITLGAALLGFVAGEMLVTDPAIATWFQQTFGHANLVVAAICAVLVVVIGKQWAKKRAAAAAARAA